MQARLSDNYTQEDNYEGQDIYMDDRNGQEIYMGDRNGEEIYM